MTAKERLKILERQMLAAETQASENARWERLYGDPTQPVRTDPVLAERLAHMVAERDELLEQIRLYPQGGLMMHGYGYGDQKLEHETRPLVWGS